MIALSFLQVYDTPPTNRWQQPVPAVSAEENESIYNTPRAVPVHTEQGSEVKEQYDTVSNIFLIHQHCSCNHFSAAVMSLSQKKKNGIPPFKGHTCFSLLWANSFCLSPSSCSAGHTRLRRSSWSDTLSINDYSYHRYACGVPPF